MESPNEMYEYIILWIISKLIIFWYYDFIGGTVANESHIIYAIYFVYAYIVPT